MTGPSILAEIFEWIRARVRWLLLRGLLILSQRKKLDGIEVVDAAEEDGERTLERLRGALNVIEKGDPRRYQRLKRDLRRIVLVRAGDPEFASEIGACILRSGYVRESEPAALASTLVHEATHARLCRLGIGYGPALRARVEGICVREQIAFAERIGSVEILDHLRQKLDRPWWTRAQLQERRIVAWRNLGVPEWAVRWYERRTRGAPR
ncbi:MAG: hypothetical protein ACJ8DC_04605 [Gemmatimonadales bacterium]